MTMAVRSFPELLISPVGVCLTVSKCRTVSKASKVVIFVQGAAAEMLRRQVPVLQMQMGKSGDWDPDQCWQVLNRSSGPRIARLAANTGFRSL